MEQHLNHLEYTVKAITELVLKHHAITTQSGQGSKHSYSETYHEMLSGEPSYSRRLSPWNDPDSKGKCKVMFFIKHDAMKVDWRVEV